MMIFHQVSKKQIVSEQFRRESLGVVLWDSSRYFAQVVA